MTEREVIDRVVATYQVYDQFGQASYRTAVVWASPDGLVIDGRGDPFLVWTVTADSSGTAGEMHGCDTEEAARQLASDWVGRQREVPVKKVAPSALGFVFTAVTGHPLR